MNELIKSAMVDIIKCEDTKKSLDKINEIRLKMFCAKADIFIPDTKSKLYKFYMGED
jgi:hypothetical protein